MLSLKQYLYKVRKHCEAIARNCQFFILLFPQPEFRCPETASFNILLNSFIAETLKSTWISDKRYIRAASQKQIIVEHSSLC